MAADLEEFRAFQRFWRTAPEASVLAGEADLARRPYLSMAHDAMLSLLLAVHNLVAAGGDVSNGSAVREALGQVTFRGASGDISFTSNLDLMGGSFEFVTNLDTWDAATGSGPLEFVGSYDAGTQAFEMRDDRLARLFRVRQTAVCGDGVTAADEEECDDGNVQDGDGCSAQCLVETAHTCTRPTCSNSTCSRIVVAKAFTPAAVGFMIVTPILIGIVLVWAGCKMWVRRTKLDEDEELRRLSTNELREILQV